MSLQARTRSRPTSLNFPWPVLGGASGQPLAPSSGTPATRHADPGRQRQPGASNVLHNTAAVMPLGPHSRCPTYQPLRSMLHDVIRPWYARIASTAGVRLGGSPGSGEGPCGVFCIRFCCRRRGGPLLELTTTARGWHLGEEGARGLQRADSPAPRLVAAPAQLGPPGNLYRSTHGQILP